MTTDLKCPNCAGLMRPVAMICEPCHVRVEGRFDPANEFARLSRDELHLLRIFVHTEGSIREMESALGISYPTVKQRLAALREKLQASVHTAHVPSPHPPPPIPPSPPPATDVATQVGVVLQDMKAGRIAPADAARLIRELRSIEGKTS